MAQILDPIPNDQKHSFLCCYVNATSQIQIARISNIANWYFERVVFPGQRLVFEALPKALLEIHTGMMASAILSDTIPCDRLRIGEGVEFEENGHNGNSASVATDTDNHNEHQKPQIKTDHKTPTNINFLKPAVSFC